MDLAAGARYSSNVIPVWNSSVRFGFFIISVLMVQELRRRNRRLLELAHTDSLTGVAHVRSFYMGLEREIGRQRRQGSVFSLVFIDLDRFKQVNDAFGHRKGDEVLRRVAAGISSVLRSSDTFGRLGGDEFGVLLPETARDGAFRAASKISAVVASILKECGCDVLGAGATLGVVVFEEPPESGDDAVRMADEQMYKGKALGRGSVTLAVWRRSGLVEP